MPLGTPGAGATREVVIPERIASSSNETLPIRYNQVSPDFLTATGTRLLAGRGLAATDTASSMRVALVNQTMSRLFWPERGAVEQRVRVDNTDTLIVGVIEDSVIGKIHENPEPYMVFPFAQLPVNEVTFIMETAGKPDLLLDAAKRELRAVKPDIAILLTDTLQQLLHNALYADWLPALLSSGIGLMGMILAAAGLFGVVLQGVNRRFREMGVRMALGAQSRALVGLVLRHGLMLAGLGTIVGALAFLGTGRMLDNLLHGVGPYDPIVLLFSICLVLAMAITASLYPAWKATRVDPAAVLRME
jgi:hypothetical protein